MEYLIFLFGGYLLRDFGIHFICFLADRWVVFRPKAYRSDKKWRLFKDIVLY